MSKAIVPTPFGPMVVRREPHSFDPFQGFFGLAPMTACSTEAGSFKVDLKETDDSYEVKADFPGIDKADVTVSIKDDVLTISYESQSEEGEKDENGKWIFHERRSASMKRSFMVPESDDEKAEASMDNGVLSIVIPKKEVQEPKSTNVEIS